MHPSIRSYLKKYEKEFELEFTFNISRLGHDSFDAIVLGVGDICGGGCGGQLWRFPNLTADLAEIRVLHVHGTAAVHLLRRVGRAGLLVGRPLHGCGGRQTVWGVGTGGDGGGQGGD